MDIVFKRCFVFDCMARLQLNTCLHNLLQTVQCGVSFSTPSPPRSIDKQIFCHVTASYYVELYSII